MQFVTLLICTLSDFSVAGFHFIEGVKTCARICPRMARETPLEALILCGPALCTCRTKKLQHNETLLQTTTQYNWNLTSVRFLRHTLAAEPPVPPWLGPRWREQGGIRIGFVVSFCSGNAFPNRLCHSECQNCKQLTWA
jgi:hypothetical protein